MVDSVFIRYSFSHGPGKERFLDGMIEANCQWWSHYDLRSLRIELPHWMRSKEMYEDEEKYFRSLQSSEISKRGDIYLFGKNELADARFLHVAVHSGYQLKETGEPILTHATVLAGTVVAWPLGRFLEEPRYHRLFAIKRPIMLDGK